LHSLEQANDRFIRKSSNYPPEAPLFMYGRFHPDRGCSW